jgi:PEP-CTERM motif
VIGDASVRSSLRQLKQKTSSTMKSRVARFFSQAITLCVAILFSLVIPAHGDNIDTLAIANPCPDCPDIIPANKVTFPTADLIKVESPSGKDNGQVPDDNAAKLIGASAIRMKSLADTIMEIMMASQTKGRPISVVLVGHGSPGVISVGAGLRNDFDTFDEVIRGGFGGTETKFVDGVKGKVSSLTLFSCCTGFDTVGMNFLQLLSTDLGNIPVSGYNSQIKVQAKGGADDGFYAVGGDKALVRAQVVPEPSAWLLVGSGLIGFVLVRKKFNRF